MTKHVLIFSLLVLMHSQVLAAIPDSLRTKIQEISGSINAEVGIAILAIEGGDTLTINGQKHFPMQSVYKLHQALAILNLVDQGKLKMDQKIRVTKEDYFPTWSPMAKKYQQTEVDLPLSELLMFTLANSDNVACDVLFRLAPPNDVQKFIESIGGENVAIVSTEREMHADWNLQFENWNTPYDMVLLLQKLNQKKILSEASHEFMWNSMAQCSTGPRRIKGLLPSNTEVAHRTGTGGPNDEGILGAVNNVGIITLPNGQHVALAFYIMRSKDSQAKVEESIAKISRIVYDHFNTEK
jgi:beta-lactamase class A